MLKLFLDWDHSNIAPWGTVKMFWDVAFFPCYLVFGEWETEKSNLYFYESYNWVIYTTWKVKMYYVMLKLTKLNKCCKRINCTELHNTFLTTIYNRNVYKNVFVGFLYPH